MLLRSFKNRSDTAKEVGDITFAALVAAVITFVMLSNEQSSAAETRAVSEEIGLRGLSGTPPDTVFKALFSFSCELIPKGAPQVTANVQLLQTPKGKQHTALEYPIAVSTPGAQDCVSAIQSTQIPFVIQEIASVGASLQESPSFEVDPLLVSHDITDAIRREVEFQDVYVNQ